MFDHCVQGTDSAAIAKGIDIPHAELIIRKGFHNDVDSYSAFLEADKETKTGLASYLKERRIDTIFVTGLAHGFLRRLDGDRRPPRGVQRLCG